MLEFRWAWSQEFAGMSQSWLWVRKDTEKEREGEREKFF